MITFLLVLTGLPVFSDESVVLFETSSASYSLTPGIEYPIEFGQILLTLGGQASLSARLPFAFLPTLNLTPSLTYSFIPVKAVNSLSVLQLSAGPGFTLEPDPRLSLEGSLRGGLYFGFFNQSAVSGDGIPYEVQSGIGPWLGADTEILLFLSPSFSLGLRLAYCNSLGLYQSLSAGIITRLNIEGLRSRVILQDIEIESIFPGISRYYDRNPAGSFSLENNERFPMKDLRVELYIQDFMDKPRLCYEAGDIAPGARLSGPLNLLFNDEILNLTDDRKISVQITASYNLNGENRTQSITEQTVLYNRNAVTWDDDRKAAAFISSKSPDILEFAGTAALAASNTEIISPSRNMSIALAVYDSMQIYGLSYVIDPETPSYEEAKQQTGQIDFIQFPLQTLQYRGGDCDDLTVLYCSLLEAAGVETALLTVPGHIMPAFAVKAPPAEALKIFSRKDDLIIDGGKAWIPVEITMLSEGFFRAWTAASLKWHEYAETGAASIYPVRSAWELYPPSGGPEGGPKGLGLKAASAPSLLASSFNDDLEAFITSEISPREARLKKLIAETNTPARNINSLGALYGRYGLYKKAEEQFRAALLIDNYLPALINMGNLHFMKSEFTEALDYYLQAEEIQPEKASILLALARTNYELGKLAAAKKYHALLSSAAPELASRYSYIEKLDTGSERAESGAEREVLWEDE